MNYFGLVNKILSIAESHNYVYETYYGDVYEFENSGRRKYGNVVLTPTQSVDSGDVTTYTFSLFATDRLTDDKSNKVAVQSLCKSIVTAILNKLCESGEVSLSSATYYYWEEKFNDLCAGCYASFSISLPREEVCVGDVLPKVTKHIASNGIYDVSNVDEVDVAVEPILEPLTATENKTYEPAKGVQGFSKVDVNVPLVIKGISQLSSEYAGELPYIFDFDGLTAATIFARGCSKITKIGCIINTSAVTNMSRMFQDCSSLTTLDISKWDTSAVTNMSQMFRTCRSLQTLDVSKWDTSAVTDMSYMFCVCSSLQTLDVSKWNTSAVTDMSYMFYYCRSLQTLDVSKWDTSAVTNMSYMFYYCQSLTTLDVSKWDTSAVTNMSRMFQDCSSLTTLDLTGLFDCGACTNVQDIYSSRLKSVIGSHTLAEVESGEIVACKNMGKNTFAGISKLDFVRYSSILAVVNGTYDRKAAGLANQTFYIGRVSFNNMLNDDDTIPDSATITERQNKVLATLTAKGYNIAYV